MISKYDFQIVVDLYIASFIKVNTGAQYATYKTAWSPTTKSATKRLGTT